MLGSGTQMRSAISTTKEEITLPSCQLTSINIHNFLFQPKQKKHINTTSLTETGTGISLPFFWKYTQYYEILLKHKMSNISQALGMNNNLKLIMVNVKRINLV